MNSFFQDILKDIKILAAIFFISFLFGILFYALFLDKPCRTRLDLCKLDIVHIESLKSKLSKLNAECIEKIDTAVSLEKESNKKAFDKKYKRLEKACNELDCLQCDIQAKKKQ